LDNAERLNRQLARAETERDLERARDLVVGYPEETPSLQNACVERDADNDQDRGAAERLASTWR